MLWTVLGSNRARGKKKRRNIRKLAVRYPQTAVQMSRRRSLLGAVGATFCPSALPVREVPAGGVFVAGVVASGLAGDFGASIAASPAANLGETGEPPSRSAMVWTPFALKCYLAVPNVSPLEKLNIV